MDPEEVGQESAPVENSPIEQTETAETEGGFNPAWEPLRQSLGIQFEVIKPELAKIDKAAQDHITKVNGSYAPWKDFDTEGITPDQVRQSLAAIQQMNDNPEALYESLGTYLRENGRLPETAAEVAEVVADAEGEDLDPQAKKIAELEDQIKKLIDNQQAQTEEQQKQAAEEKAQKEVDAEYSAFEKAHPDLSQADMQTIARLHFAAVSVGDPKTLEEVGQEYFDLVGRIQSAPRPNDSAPRLPGAGGAAPAPQTKDPSQFSREESQDALAAFLQQSQQS